MLDSHSHPPDWGILPILIQIGPIAITSYNFFILLALCVGALVYYLEAREHKSTNEGTFFVAIAALVGGTIGAKLLIWLSDLPFIVSHISQVELLLSGRTIVGGLIGGWIGVVLTKKRLGITVKKGNLFAPAIAAGMIFGRIGCFLQGCCFGIGTKLPWGVDFGDGVKRHPTQIYEIIFWLGMYSYLQWAKRLNQAPGALFSRLITSYFIFRFFLEFLKSEQRLVLNLTIYQYVAILVLIFQLWKGIIDRVIRDKTV